MVHTSLHKTFLTQFFHEIQNSANLAFSRIFTELLASIQSCRYPKEILFWDGQQQSANDHPGSFFLPKTMTEIQWAQSHLVSNFEAFQNFVSKHVLAEHLCLEWV